MNSCRDAGQAKPIAATAQLFHASRSNSPITPLCYVPQVPTTDPMTQPAYSAANPPSLSLVYLCLNEEEALPRTLTEAVTWCEANLHDWEILVVDDGSTDASAAIIRDFSAKQPRVRLLQHATNRGMGAGLRTAIAASTKAYYCMLAADGQIGTAEVGKLFDLLREAPVVTSVYDNRKGPIRLFLSRGFRLYMRTLVGVDFALEGTYLFPVALARDEIGLDNVGADTFFFSFELIARALQRGVAVKTGVISVRPRTDGGPSRVANFKRIQRVAGEVLQLRRRLAE